MSIAWPWDTPGDGQPWPGPTVDEMTAYAQQQGAGQTALDGAVLSLRAPDSLHADTATVPNVGTGTGLDLEPVAVRGCRVRSTDPAVLAVHTSTDVTDAFTTPHAAGLVITGDHSIRARWRAIGDAEAAGGEDGSQVLGKITSLDDQVAGYDEVDYSLWVGLASPFDVGEITLIWTDTSDVQHSITSVGANLDPYELNEVRADLDADNGDSGHTVTFYVGDGEGNWTQLGEPTVTAGTTDVRNESGPLCAGSFSTLVDYAEVYDGIGEAATLIASFRAADAAGAKGPADTFTSAATEETWTLGTDCATFDHPGTAALVCGGSTAMTVADDAQLDPGTADRSIAVAVTVAKIITANGGDAPIAKMATGTVGQGGTGWNLTDIKVDAFGLDGFGFIASDGTNTAAAISSTGWTAGARHVAVGAFDRSGNLVTYVDGTARGTADMSSVGSIAPSAGLVLGQAGKAPFLLHAWAEWPRLLTADEIAAVTARIGAA